MGLTRKGFLPPSRPNLFCVFFSVLRQASSQILSHEVQDHVDGQLGGVGGDVAFAGDGCLAFEGAADVVLAVDHGEAAINVDPFEQWFASCD